MPTYAYGCGCGNSFEQYGSLDASVTECPVCHNPARRRPFSGIPYLKGDTVARSIPDPAYRQEAEKRELNRTWGDASRSVELMRKHTVTDETGQKHVNIAAVNREG